MRDAIGYFFDKETGMPTTTINETAPGSFCWMFVKPPTQLMTRRNWPGLGHRETESPLPGLRNAQARRYST